MNRTFGDYRYVRVIFKGPFKYLNSSSSTIPLQSEMFNPIPSRAIFSTYGPALLSRSIRSLLHGFLQSVNKKFIKWIFAALQLWPPAFYRPAGHWLLTNHSVRYNFTNSSHVIKSDRPCIKINKHPHDEYR